jgi:flagellar basal body-associated protein FliL
MNFILKIENAINSLLNKLGELIYKAIPAPLKSVLGKILAALLWPSQNIKRLPSLIKTLAITLISKTKSAALGFNYKAALVETYKKAVAQYKEKSPKSAGKISFVIQTPFLIIAQWLRGLSAAQSMLLLTFSCASILAVIGIGFSGHKLMNTHGEEGRIPASISEEIVYERPDYYKKQTKHVEITNLRLPVYIAKLNEIRSVDIDFTATLTNRYARMFLERQEFQLRDHLILQLEPSISSFPIQEEGKEIIRRKLLNEVNDFLKQHEIEGEVIELKITYVLAN